MSPINDYNVVYGTSKAVVKMIDLRERSDCTNSGVKYED